MRKNVSAILESLRHHEISEAYTYGDVLMVDNRRKFEEAISNGIVNKLSSKFSKFGALEVSVDVDLADDDNRDLEDIADEIHVNLFFTNPVEGTSPREVLKLIASLKPFKGMSPKYDTRSDVYYVDVKGNEDCSDFVTDLEKLGISFKKACHVETERDIENAMLDRQREDREERAYLEREYNRSRM